MNNRLDLVVQVPCDAWSNAINRVEALSHRAATAAFDAACGNADLPEGPVEASVVLADAATVQSLNRQYRNRDEATNVLAFASLEANPEDIFALGDIVVSYQTASAESQQSGKDINDHLCHLIVHGMLHLLGYDHQNDADAWRMETLEVDVLSGLGVTDPFTGKTDR